jgi:lambda family phage portal protein
VSILSRILAALRRRSYEAAGGGRRWQSAPGISAPVSQALAARGTLMGRARHAAENNPHARQAIEVLTAATVGTGIKPKSRNEDAGVRRALDLGFEEWTDEADATGVLDFYGLQTAAARGMFRDGEALFRMEADQDGRLQLRQLAPEQLDPTLHRELGAGARIVAGVEFDTRGRIVAHHILPDQPDLPFASVSTPVRVPADDVLHVFNPLFAGQVRGLSVLTPVLLRLVELDKCEDAQVMRQQIAAMLAGFIYKPDESAATPFDGSVSGSVLEGGLEPGTLKALPPGYDVKFSTPATIGADAVEFLRLQLRAIAAGAGVTYEQLTGDYSGSNYASSRAGLIEFRRRIEALQHHVIVRRFCRPVWRRWATLEALSGRMDAGALFADPTRFLSAEWITPGFGWVDPLKEVQAEREAVDAGFKSRREVVAARGRDIETLDEERAAEAPAAPRTESAA